MRKILHVSMFLIFITGGAFANESSDCIDAGQIWDFANKYCDCRDKNTIWNASLKQCIETKKSSTINTKINTKGREPVGDKCYFKNVGDNAGAGKANYILYFDFDSAVIPNGDCLNRLKADLKTIDIGACQTLDFDGFADGVGAVDYNIKLSRHRIDFAKNLIKELFPNADMGALFNDGNIAKNASIEAQKYEADPEHRKVEIAIITKASCGIGDNGNKTIDDAYAKVKGIMANFKASAWRDSEGEFNKARLLSDSIAGVVLGTAGGVITSSVIKKNQVESGFEDIKCNVGGQVVANWGDEFTVGSNLTDTEENSDTTTETK